MTKQTHEPGPGRSTSDAAFNAHKTEIAQRNEQTQKVARKLRSVREQEKEARKLRTAREQEKEARKVRTSREQENVRRRRREGVH